MNKTKKESRTVDERKVRIVLKVNEESDRMGDADLEVFVDGTSIGGGNIGGGEPEDNGYFRDYDWIPPLLEDLAKKLGATVTMSGPRRD